MIPSIATLLAVLLAAGQQPAPTPPAEKKICRTSVETGSRLGGKRTCLTAAEWRELEVLTNRAISDHSRSNNNWMSTPR